MTVRPRPRQVALQVASAIGALVLFAAVYWVVPTLLTTDARLSATDRQSAMSDVRSSLLATLGGLGALVGLAYTSRTFKLSQVGHLTGRFQDAAKLMGDADPLVRLGGIEAMAQLADEWSDQRQRCVDMLCAHVRHVETGGHRHSGDPIDHDEDTRRRALERIREALLPAPQHGWAWHKRPRWTECDLDFRGATLGAFDLHGVVLDDIELDLGGTTILGGVDLSGTVLRSTKIVLGGARLNDVRSEVSLDRATLDGVELNLREADLVAGSIRSIGTTFTGRTTIDMGGARVNDTFTVSFAGSEVVGDGATIELGDLRDDPAIDRGPIPLAQPSTHAATP